MEKIDFNTAIIGGGIVGSGLFRDLSLHNISTLIIDKNDFASKTSQSSSKMLHGGIRYLENFDFHLVHEALYEKNLWLKLTPDLCFEHRFYLPVYKNSPRPLYQINLGMLLYDILSGFKNTPYQIKNAKQTINDISILNASHLKGSGIYSDAVVDDAKMSLEMIYDGVLNQKCQALNYHELLEVKTTKYSTHHLTIKDVLNNEIKTFHVKHLVFAAGPFTDQVIKKTTRFNWEDIILPSKGSHLWFKTSDLPIKNPLVMTTKEGRIIFVIPQNNMVLVGTTEVPIQGEFDIVKISLEETNYLLSMINEYFPTLKLTHSHIIGSYAGIRPLVKDPNQTELGKTSREHRIVMPTKNTFVIAGGKYTTFRRMTQEIARNIIQRNNQNYDEEKTQNHLRQKSIIPAFKFRVPSDSEIEKMVATEFAKTPEDIIHRRIGINSKEMWNFHINEIDYDSFYQKLKSITKTN